MKPRLAATDAIVYRRATPHDIDGVTRLGLEALQRDPYPTLRIDASKVREMARLVISGAGNYCHVAEKDGKVVAAVSALIQPCMFYERQQANVVQFYTREPGAGLPLIRDFLRWARSRPAIKLIVFTLEVRADPRIGKLMKRLGLDAELPVWMEAR